MKEIDAITLISYLSQKSKSNVVSIDIKEMRKLGHIVEEIHPSIIADIDKYSVDSFRIKSKGAVFIYGQKMQFDKSNDVIRELFKKYRPSFELLEILDYAWMKGFGGGFRDELNRYKGSRF